MFRLYFVVSAWGIVNASMGPYAQIFLRNLGLSQSLIGVILSLGQISSCVIPLFVGNLVDKTGKLKLFYMFFTILIILSYSLIVALPKLFVIIFFFITSTACFGSISSINDTLINKSVESTNTTYSSVRALESLIYVCILVIYPLIKFPNIESNLQLLLAVVIPSIILVFGLITVQNPASSPVREKSKHFNKNWFNTGFYCLIIIIFVKCIANAVVEKLLSSYMTEVLHLGNDFTLFVALGALSEVVFMFIFGKMLKNNKISEFTLIALSCLGGFIRLSLYTISTNIYLFAFAQLFHSLTYGASHVATISYISKKVPKEHMNLATAIYTSIGINLSEFFGALGGGFIIDHFGYTALFRSYTVFPLIALGLCFTMKKQIQAK